MLDRSKINFKKFAVLYKNLRKFLNLSDKSVTEDRVSNEST